MLAIQSHTITQTCQSRQLQTSNSLSLQGESLFLLEESGGFQESNIMASAPNRKVMSDSKIKQ